MLHIFGNIPLKYVELLYRFSYSSPSSKELLGLVMRLQTVSIHINVVEFGQMRSNSDN